ncbi:amino acid adenylation domain-containing protein, partial [Agrobacterium sp. NPDC089420]|uniref:amino acid adenylation domain-containing protein n=1 Tax=Agrobacterium sp. NPDC089420 TaxID=3363918 RepID=UPI00384FDEFC
MWIGEKVGAAGVVFNLAEAVEIHGRVNVENFIRALRQLTQDIEATRIRIREIEGQPHQIVPVEFSGDFRVLDFSAEEGAFKKADDWMMDQARIQPDLEHDRLWDSALIKLAEDHWLWFQRAHHIAFDGFTGGLSSRRLAEIYTSLEDGGIPEPANYGSLEDMLAADRAYRSSQQLERDRAYWMEHLREAPQPATLAKRRPAPATGLLRHSVTLPAEDARILRKVATESGVSVPQVLVALVAAYYGRATDCDDLVILTMLTGRVGPAMRRIPCMMANAVPLRFKFSPGTTLRDLARQTAQQMMRALRYQRYRYEDMRRDLGLLRHDQQIAWLGVNIEPFDYNLSFAGHPATIRNLSNGSMTDMTIFAYERGDGSEMRIDFDANPDLYTIGDLQSHEARFMRLLRAISADADRELNSFSLLSDLERQKVLVDWNDTAHAIPDLTFPELFRRQVTRQPDAVAVVCDGRELTYAELDAASDSWARLLCRRGVVPGNIVAVVVPRSEQMLVALLAVLKAGGSYLPCDPSDPPGRIGLILADAAPSLIITTSEIADKLPIDGVRTVFLDQPEDHPAHSLIVPPAADDTAYIIFTSGSTGRPKGVEISHRALTNFLFAMQDLLKMTPRDRLLAVTTIAFDIAGLELYLPLLAGACTIIAPRETVRDPDALARLIRRSRITVMQATPSLWRALLHDHGKELYGLRSLVGGEALPADLAQAMAELGHPVLNVYGPTETTIWSTAMPLEGRDIAAPPIGRPIWNTRLYVLDRRGNPLPPGFAGELYIGGMGVAKGYLNRPELTQERFLPDPFAADDSRMYRTGDMACWRVDGVMEYLGRNDHQIKIRGFRVEPGEIEAALAAHPGVRQAVVILREDQGQGKRLVAYVVATPGHTVDDHELSATLACSLPSQMIPSRYVVLEAIPLNGNGKIDRNALPVPKWQAHHEGVAPRTETEKAIAQIWCESLGVDAVGIHDSFFDLGGDSLDAVGMIATVRSRLNVAIPLEAIFESPTIAELSNLLGASASQNEFFAPVMAIRKSGSSAPLFCIHPILGIGWAFRALTGHIAQDMPIYALQADSLSASAGLFDTIEEMALAYVNRMRRIQPNGPYHILGWSFGGLVAHEMARLLLEQGETVAFLGLLDSYPYQHSAQNILLDDVTLAQATLDFLGFDADAREFDNKRPVLSVLEEYILARYDMDTHPLAREAMKISQSETGILDKARTAIIHHLDLARKFKPGLIGVDMHFFSANRGKGRTIDALLNYQAEAWLPHVRGRIYHRPLDCLHEQMLDADPAAEIGA